MSYLKAGEVLPPVQNIINTVIYPEEIDGVVKYKLQELGEIFKKILANESGEKNCCEDEDDIARTYLPKGVFTDVTIPR